jgi:hypothetical protein
LANPSIIRGSLITTDNGDLACDDDAGRVLIELNVECPRFCGLEIKQAVR